MTALPASHSGSEQARFPQTYEAAKTALANCVAIDECKEWADKAAALASYAKQANDEEMMRQATRIRDRAIRRCGELLKQIEPGQGARDGKRGVDNDTPFRKDVAEQAGLSKRQQVTAIRVANVPEDDFERQVESANPPTVTALAEQGKRSAPKPVVDLNGRDPDEFNRAMHYVGGWEYVARDLAALDHDAVGVLTLSERARLRKAIATVDALTDRVITRI